MYYVVGRRKKHCGLRKPKGRSMMHDSRYTIRHSHYIIGSSMMPYRYCIKRDAWCIKILEH